MRGDKVLTLLRQEIERLTKIAEAIEKSQDLIDFAARLHGNCGNISALDKKLTETIKTNLGVGIHRGIRAKAEVNERSREIISSKELKANVAQHLWLPYIKQISYLEVTFKVEE